MQYLCFKKTRAVFGVKSPTSKTQEQNINAILNQQKLIIESLKSNNIINAKSPYELDGEGINNLIKLYGIKKTCYKTFADLFTAIKHRQRQYESMFDSDCDIVQFFCPEENIGAVPNLAADDDNLPNKQEEDCRQENEEIEDIKVMLKTYIGNIFRLAIDYPLKRQLIKNLQPILTTVSTSYEDVVYMTALKDILSI